jgi:hypothetical protein
MHFDPATFEDASTIGPSALATDANARCVAGCYRCLLSYFNQPDQELIDRRQEPALQFLLRLAFANTRDPQDKTQPRPDLEGCPPPDSKAIEIDGYRVELIWRLARIAAVEEGSAPPGLLDKLAARGIEAILLPSEKSTRSHVLADLAVALGGKSR